MEMDSEDEMLLWQLRDRERERKGEREYAL